MSEKCYPLAERMKTYEFVETDSKFINSQPLICRVDGRSFSKFCKHFAKPYSKIISDSMTKTSKFLLHETKAELAYHQSDEISLLFKPIENPSSRMFDGKKTKLNTVIAGMASSFFMKTILEECNKAEVDFIDYYVPHFDSRMFSVPNMTEAGNYFVWRQQDAKRNSISMMAQSMFSHRQLQSKSGTEMLEMIKNEGGDYYGMPFNFRHGSFFTKEKVMEREGDTVWFRTKVKEHDVETITYKLFDDSEGDNEEKIINKIKEYGKKSLFTDEQLEYSKNYDGDITVGRINS